MATTTTQCLGGTTMTLCFGEEMKAIKKEKNISKVARRVRGKGVHVKKKKGRQ